MTIEHCDQHGCPEHDHLVRLFKLQEELQRKMGYEFNWMSTREKVEYIRWNVLAATAELHEALDETSWKPWATGIARLDRHRFRGELVDALHFLINMWLAAGYSAHEVYEAYTAKHDVNQARQAAGYDGVSTKCANPDCRRALDEPDMAEALRRGSLAWCDDGCYDAWTTTRLAGSQEGN